MRKLMTTLFLVAVLALAYHAHAQLTDDALGKPGSVTLSGSTNYVTAAMRNFATFSTLKTTASVAATGTAITALTGRDWIEVKVSSSTAGIYVYLAVGTTTVTVGGTNCITVSYDQPFRGPIPAGTAMGHVASSAVEIDIFQAAY